MASLNAPFATEPALPPGQDYNLLRTEGLAYLQQLCGLSWTDYNEHDPGVTMLEALCYRLTEACYRASLPIPDLLAIGQPKPPDNWYGPAKRAFATPPVTLTDYGQLVLDKLPKLVKGIVVEPVDGPPQSRLYRAIIEPAAPPLSGLTTDEAQLRAEVLHVLNFHRNLGDVFAEVTVSKPRAVRVSGQVALDAGQSPTLALASLLVELEGQLPGLAARGVPSDGQPLYLRARPYQPDTPAIPPTAAADVARQAGAYLKQASRTVGIHTIRELRVQPVDALQGRLARDEVPVLDLAETLTYLTVTQQGLLVSPNYREVLQAYYAQTHYAQALADSLPVTHQAALAGYQPPCNQDYGSVQDLLPPLYGVGAEGPPLANWSPPSVANPTSTASSLTARTHIVQLKGYLLLFDQLLANFYAQLEQLGAYFSPANQPNLTPYGLLYEVPYVAPLLPDTAITPDDAWDSAPKVAANWQTYRNDPENAYVQGLQQLATDSVPAASSREAFLRHLLARFGYAPPPVPIDHATMPTDQVAATYERLLSQLEMATYHRAAARLPAHATDAARPHHAYAESGLELFLYLLTGLEPLARKWAAYQQLAELEAQLRPGAPLASQATPQLVVRGQATDFGQLVDELADQLDRLASQPRAATNSPLPGSWQLEISGLTAASSQQLGDELTRLAARLERFCLLDHAVLRPYPLRADEPDEALYYCRTTILLPGYAPRFRQQGKHDSHNRRLVEHLIQQYTPAHLLVTVLWLDYPAMRQWEGLYAALAQASGLLNPSGRFQEAALPEAQRYVRQFLATHPPSPQP